MSPCLKVRSAASREGALSEPAYQAGTLLMKFSLLTYFQRVEQVSSTQNATLGAHCLHHTAPGIHITTASVERVYSLSSTLNIMTPLYYRVR